MKNISEMRQHKTWETLDALLTRLLGADSAEEIIRQSRTDAQEYFASLKADSISSRDELCAVIVPRVCVIKELRRRGIDASVFAGIYFHEIMEPVISGRREPADELVSAVAGVFSKLQSGVGSVVSSHHHVGREARKALWDEACISLGCPEACRLFGSDNESRSSERDTSVNLAYLGGSRPFHGGTHFFGGHGSLD